MSSMPQFLIGTALADMENMVHRPLDRLRDLSIWWKIPINFALVTIIFIWGSISDDDPVMC